MIIILRSVVYSVIALVSSVYSWNAKADAGPPYSGPSVFVPFVNATDVGNPLKYVSPQITVGFNSPNATNAHPMFPVIMDTGSVGIIVGSFLFHTTGSWEVGSGLCRPRKRNAYQQRDHIHRRLV
jgi:hypothetical protein